MRLLEQRCVVNGDDFIVLGWKRDLDRSWTEISKMFQSKHKSRLGPEESDHKEIRIPDRIVTWTQEGLRYESDRRHVESCLQEVGSEERS